MKAQIESLGRRAHLRRSRSRRGGLDQRPALLKVSPGSGKLDLLVNNAGVEKNAPFWEVTEHDYDFVLDTNLKGPFFCAQAFVKHLQGRKSPGKIINISSVHEELPFPHFSTYCASKGGLKMLCRDLAIELAPLGITVNNIAPGAIETPINKALLNDPSEAERPAAKHPAEPPRPARRCLLRRRLPRLVRGRLHHRHTLVVDGGLTWNYSEQ